MNVASAKEFAGMLGGESIVLDTPDGELDYSKELAIAIGDIMRKYRVDLVLQHWKNSMHKDHIAASKLTQDAIFFASLPTFERPLPPAPGGLSAAPCEGGFKVTFTPPRDGMTGFKVYRKKFLGADFLASVKTPEAVVPAPVQGETTDIVVTAIDECGLESEQSAKLTIGK